MQQIPFLDIRDSEFLALTERYPEKARALILASREAFGVASRLASIPALPLGDTLAKRWLERTNNPYAPEIHAYAKLLNTPGVYALNLAYEWGCTSGVYRSGHQATLTRVLDWPFSGLGEHMVVTHQRGAGGEFYNVTWPGVSGVFNAVAPGRFAAALNQAPMRRWKGNIVTDWMRNRVRVWKEAGLPPAHLLRKAFETAGSYEEAKKILAEEPISLPVIYILSGAKEGEGCVIERLEHHYAIRELGAAPSVCAANHFETYLNGIGHGWMPRAIDSSKRSHHAHQLSCEIDNEFRWLSGPVANPLTRLAMTANAATGALSLQGMQGATPVTSIYIH